MKAIGKGYHARNTKPLIGGWLQLFIQMCKIFFSLFPGMFFVQKRYTFAFKNYSWEFQTALLLLNVYYLRWIIRPANTNQVRCFKLLDNRWPGCQRLFIPGFRFRSILYSEWCAHICLASSQNSNVWRPNIHVWTHFEPIFSLRVHGWTQTTVSQLAGVRGCRRKRQLSFFAIESWLFIYWCSEDLNKQFSPSRNRFLRRTPTSQDRFALR